MEGLNHKESSEARLDKMSLVRDEIRNALIMVSCGDNADFNACMKEWALHGNEEYERLFEEFSGEDDNFLDRWDDPKEQSGIIRRFEERISTTTFKRAA
ncbi:hypothetical protein KW796_00615 [Candidatus Parcubacteria bacterium]|nr:hypothetical protein [Candidatus Parcubacteria bacterium]